MIDTSWNPPAGGWSMEPQPVILPAVNSPAPTPTKTEFYDALGSLGTVDDEDPQGSVGDMKVARKIAARRRKAGWRG